MTSIGFPALTRRRVLNPVLPQIGFSDSTSALGPTGGNVAGAGFSSGVRFVSVVYVGDIRGGRTR